MMQVSWKRQLILAIFLFTVGTVAYWLEFKHKPKKESLEEQSKKVFGLKDVPVHSIRIMDPKNPIELVCSDLGAKLCKSGDQSKWELKAPLRLKADDSNANSLLSSLNNLNSTEVIDLREETPEKRAVVLKEYGLDLSARKSPAVRKMVLKSDKGETVAYFGGTHPIGEGIFVAVGTGSPDTDASIDDSKVFLIPSYFKSNFEHDLTYWRDKKLLTLSANEVQSFNLMGTKIALTAERKEGQWTLKTSPGFKEEFAGDIENIDSLLSGVGGINAKTFHFENKSDPAAVSFLKGAKKIVTLVMQKDKGTEKEPPPPITMLFYQKEAEKNKSASTAKSKDKAAAKESDSKIYVTVSNLDPIFEVENSSKDKVDKSLKDLRLTKLITSMERFSAKRLEFSGSPVGPKPLIFTQKDGKWIDTDNKEPNKEKILDTLDRLSGNRIKDYLMGSSIPTGEAEGLKFSLGDEKTEIKRQFVFWKNNNNLYARDLLSNRKEVLTVDSALKDGLPWDKAFYDKVESTPAPAPGAASAPGSGKPPAFAPPPKKPK